MKRQPLNLIHLKPLQRRSRFRRVVVGLLDATSEKDSARDREREREREPLCGLSGA